MRETGSAGELVEGAGLPPLERAAAIMRFLRSAEGCPWDREQTFGSLQRYTLEEVYEVFDAIEREAWDELRDELGDLLLQVLFYSQMAADAGHFSIEDVASGLNAKLIRRHPHVFGEVLAADAAAVVTTWDRVKQEERAGAFAGVMSDVPRSMPAMLEAAKLGSRAAKVGFDWPQVDGVLAKLEEEIGELRAELAGRSAARMEEELGDVLFTVVNLARHLGADAERGLRGSNRRFRSRFEAMEAVLGEEGRPGREGMMALGTEEWEALWKRAKGIEPR